MSVVLIAGVLIAVGVIGSAFSPPQRRGGGRRPRGCSGTASTGLQCARGPDHSGVCTDIDHVRPPSGGGGVARPRR